MQNLEALSVNLTQQQLLAELSKLPPEQVLELIMMIRTGVNEKIQFATRHLKVYAKCTSALTTFLQIACSEQPLGARQLASILIDRSLKHTFLELPDESRQLIRSSLLERYFKEPERLMRRSLAHNITMVVRYQNDLNKPWEELLKILANQFANGDPLLTGVSLI